MPLYEYQCPTHGTFEVIQKFSDAPLTTCPNCGAEVTKLLSAPAIQFKGTGWYITDYARKGSGGEDKKGGSKEGAARTGDSGGGQDAGRKDAGGKDPGGAKDSGSSTATTDSKPSNPAK